MSGKPTDQEWQDAAPAGDIDVFYNWAADEIAIELGIPPRGEREWTQKELDRILAAFELRSRPSD
jgi:hypothetical protein